MSRRIDFLPFLLMSVTRLTPTICVKPCLVDVAKLLVSPGTKEQKSGRMYSTGNHLDWKSQGISFCKKKEDLLKKSSSVWDVLIVSLYCEEKKQKKSF